MRPNCWFNIWPFSTRKNAQKHEKRATDDSNFAKATFNISPNLTLVKRNHVTILANQMVLFQDAFFAMLKFV